MNESKGIVYLAGPISGSSGNFSEYHEDYSLAGRLVRKAGYIPVGSYSLPLGLRESDYMRIGIAILEAADTVVALKGWTESQGAQIEWAYAQQTGKRCMTLAQFCEEHHILATPEDMEVGKREKAG